MTSRGRADGVQRLPPYLVPALLRTLDRFTAPEGRVVLVQNIHRAATDAFLAAAADVWNVTREPRGRLYEVWTLTRHTVTACGSSITS